MDLVLFNNMFEKKKESNNENSFIIQKLMAELEEAKSLTPTSQEVFDDIDWSCLWRDEVEEGGIMKLMPLIAVIITSLILIITIFKK